MTTKTSQEVPMQEHPSGAKAGEPGDAEIRALSPDELQAIAGGPSIINENP